MAYFNLIIRLMLLHILVNYIFVFKFSKTTFGFICLFTGIECFTGEGCAHSGPVSQ